MRWTAFLVLLVYPTFTLWTQGTYFGPKGTAPSQNLVRVEVSVRDGDTETDLQVDQVFFDGVAIPLKPRDISGYRGSASFQKKPGRYPLKWVVNRSKFAWPRNVAHEEIITINPRDLWMQISIEGDLVTVH